MIPELALFQKRKQGLEFNSGDELLFGKEGAGLNEMLEQAASSSAGSRQAGRHRQLMRSAGRGMAAGARGCSQRGRKETVKGSGKPTRVEMIPEMLSIEDSKKKSAGWFLLDSRGQKGVFGSALSRFRLQVPWGGGRGGRVTAMEQLGIG